MFNNLVSVASILSGLVLFTLRRDPIISVKLDDGYPGSEYDFIIVGGGTAGCVLAARLSENPNWSVLVLEMGPDETASTYVPAFGGIAEFSRIFKSVPQKYSSFGLREKRSYQVAGRVIGGTSSVNAMVYNRGNRHDYDHWAELGNYGWSYDEVLPFFIRSEDQQNEYLKKSPFHGVGGPVPVSDITFPTKASDAFLDAVRELGYRVGDVNGFSQLRFNNPQKTKKNGIRYSSATSYLRPIAKKRRNLHISLTSTVHKILLDSTHRAIGVVYERGGDIRKVLARKEVILSAGAMESPKLLMLSGIGPPHRLKHVGIYPHVDLSGVGENLHDHIWLASMVWTVDKGAAASALNALNVKNIMQYKFNMSGYLSRGLISDGLGFVKVIDNEPYKRDWPDLQISIDTKHMFYGSTLRSDLTAGFTDEILDVYKDVRITEGITLNPMLQRPRSRGVLWLGSKDPTDPPLFDFQFLSHPYDVDVLVEGVKMCMKIGKTYSMKKIGAKFYKKTIPPCRKYRPWSHDYIICYIRHMVNSIFHTGGTCKMGPPEDHYAVVDPELRVYGVSGLRVIDSSAMPTPIVGNNMAVMYMMAEKGAQMIRDYWYHNH